MPSHYADLYIALYATMSAALPYLISHLCCILGMDLHMGMYTVQTDTAQTIQGYVQYSTDNGTSSLHGESAAVTQRQH